MSSLAIRWGRIVLSLALSHVMLCESAGAQEAVAADQRVRLWVSTEPDSPVVGDLVSVNDDHITVDVPINSGYESQALARSAIERAEVSEGYERTGNWKRGAAIGAGIGFAVGGLAGLAVRGLEGENSQTEPLVGAAAGAIVGGIAGAIIGTGPKKERWRGVPIESLHVGVRTEGVSLAIAVRL